MDRQNLIDQVKTEYAYLADIGGHAENSDHLNTMSAEAYYEHLLGQVIKEIKAGTFDGFTNGRDIVEAVANNKGNWGITI